MPKTIKTSQYRIVLDLDGNRILTQQDWKYLINIRIRPYYVEKILYCPTLTNRKKLKSLLGVISYSRSYIPNFSELTAEMNTQRLEKKVTWTETMQECWEILKEELVKDIFRAYP